MITLSKLHNSAFRTRNSQAGFTLVELIVTLVIVAIVGLLISSGFRGVFSTPVDARNRMSLQREVDRAMEHIVRNLRGATGATITGGNQITIDLLSGGSVIFSTAAGELRLDGVNIIVDPGNSGIEVNNLAFSSATVNGKLQVTTTLSLKYADRSNIDQVVEFRTVTKLRNS